MGKRLTIVILLITALIMSMGLAGFGSNAYPYRAFIYGYNSDTVKSQYYEEGYSTLHNMVMRFSGIETYWDPTPGGWTDPSTHKALCNRGWDSHYKRNAQASYIYIRLSEDALFQFFRHGNCHSLQCANNTCLTDDDAFTVPGYSNYYLEFLDDLDDMKFALLLSCYSSQGEGPNLTSMLRCIKKVDTVIGFNTDIVGRKEIYVGGQVKYMYPTHVWNQCFWTYTERHGYNCGNAEGLADGMVWNHCYNNYWGLDSSETWGNASASLYYPGNGVIE